MPIHARFIGLLLTDAVLVLGAGAAQIAGSGPASAAPFDATKPEHWGIITRNTIGSPVGELRFGPYGSFGHTGPTARPPFRKGSLGIEVADRSTSLVPPSEKVDFGNEVDFFGDPVLALDEVGFHVFQTGENIAPAGPANDRNVPVIRFEIDPNLTACPAVNYTSMVWVPDPIPAASINEWSDYIDATTTGNWYFTNFCVATETTCTELLTCDFTQAMTALNDGAPTPITYTVQVGKGRDNMWVGAVDGLRLNRTIYDFEESGVRSRRIGEGHDDDDDDDD
jgi:hypothetical protein